MRHLTQVEFDDLIAAREERDKLARLIADGPLDLRARAEALACAAKLQGLVVTMEQRPLVPLAMGHFETVITVRTSRERAEPIQRT